MLEKIKQFLRKTCKLVGIVCIVLVGILIVCGLPLEKIKEKIQNSLN